MQHISDGLGGSLPWAVNIIYYVIYILVMARILLSFASMILPHFNRASCATASGGGRPAFERFVNDITDPLLKPFTLLIPMGQMALDLSPVVLILALDLTRTILLFLLS